MSQNILIATLGSKPQLIMFALDCLQQMGEDINSLIIIHASKKRIETQQALDKIQTDVDAFYPALQWQGVELQDKNQPLVDIISPEEIQAAFHV